MKTKYKSLSRLLNLVITCSILYYIFTIIPFSRVIESITSAHMGYVTVAIFIELSYIAVSVFISLLTHFIAAFRMRYLTEMQGMPFTVLQLLEIDLITKFYGLFLPGKLTGGAIRLYKLSYRDGKWVEAFAAIAFNRLTDTIILVILGMSFWFLHQSLASQPMIGFLL